MKNRIISVLLAVVVCLTAFFAVSCSDKDIISGKEIIIETNTHKIYKEDGKCYIELSEPAGEYKKSMRLENADYYSMDIQFNNMDELMLLLNTDLSDEYNYGIRKCFLVGEDNVLEIFDVENPQVPILPEGVDSYTVDWSRWVCTFYYESNGGITISVIPTENFSHYVDYNYGQDFRHLEKSEKYECEIVEADGIEMTVFKNSTYKHVFYKHEENGKQIYVHEEYWADYVDVESDLPYFINVVAMYNGVAYHVTIGSPTEIYTLEQLMEIKTEPYVPEEAE